MRIKLILPSYYLMNGDIYRTTRSTKVPYSIFYLAALVPAGHEVTATDETVEAVDFDDPVDLVGISCYTTNIKRAYDIADAYRKKGVTVVLGGIHVTCLPDEASRHADSIVIGEAEDSWPELISDFEGKKMKSRYSRPPRSSLGNLPHPRFDLINFAKYHRYPLRKHPVLSISTARGCPHDCEFCSVSRFYGNKVRFRPIEDVIEEVKLSNTDTIFFTDENFLASQKRAVDLCEKLIPLKIKYICQTDSTIYKKQALVTLLVRSGCMWVCVGLETINPVTLKAQKKGFNNPEMYAALIGLFRKNGITVNTSMIFGFDEDSYESVDDTVRFLVKNKSPIASFFPLTPFPGTQLYDKLLSAGKLINKNWWLELGNDPENWMNYVKQSDKKPKALALCHRALKRFYSYPSIARRFPVFRKSKLLFLFSNLLLKKSVQKSKSPFTF